MKQVIPPRIRRNDYWPEKLVGIACGRALLYGTLVGFSAGIVIGIVLTKILMGR